MQDRYLVQFLDWDRGFWITDCAFQEGQLGKASAYVGIVLQCDSTRAIEGIVLDRAIGNGYIVYRAYKNGR